MLPLAPRPPTAMGTLTICRPGSTRPWRGIPPSGRAHRRAVPAPSLGSRRSREKRPRTQSHCSLTTCCWEEPATGRGTPCPPNLHPGVLTPGTSEQGLLWTQGSGRCNQLRRDHTLVAPIQQHWCPCDRGNVDTGAPRQRMSCDRHRRWWPSASQGRAWDNAPSQPRKEPALLTP